jgi:hypothetical protein
MNLTIWFRHSSTQCLILLTWSVGFVTHQFPTAGSELKIVILLHLPSCVCPNPSCPRWVRFHFLLYYYSD